MNAIQKNYVAGEWVESDGVSHNVNPSNTQDIIPPQPAVAIGSWRSGPRT
jgi:hypothetical protein